MHAQIPHTFSKDQAVKRVRRALEESRSKFSEHAEVKDERWEGDTLHFGFALQGKEITGTLEVRDSEFILDAKLPLMWRIFEGKIEQMIADQVRQLR